MSVKARDKVLLKEIFDLIDLTIKNVPKSKAEFLKDHNAKDAAALRIQAIGEHMRGLSDEFREQHPALPWRQAIAMRNIIAHDYGNLDYEIVWVVVTGKDFASFYSQVKKILES